ncbi:MAG: hypothetical protein J6P37_08975 [Lachnospiraceae bacterium]|nr:hypothetical protein [Lachnospiraceae bacterium]
MKIKEFFKEKKNKSLFVKCLVALLFPFALCLIYCLSRGIALWDIYVPASKNNDSLYYFKLVESMRYNLFPGGYFGFNESHAANLTFAAWSPLMLLPWAIASLIFGWGFKSAVFINILLFAIAFTLFVYLTDLEIEKLIYLTLLYSLFPSFFIHLMCILPEASIAGLTLIFLGLAYRISNDKETNKKCENTSIIFLILISAFLTLLRPYMVALFIIPIVLSFKNKKTAFAIVSIIVTFVSLAGYFIIAKLFTAEYFTPLFNLEIIKLFLHGKFTEGFWTSVYVIRDMKREIFAQIADAFSYGLTSGTHYVLLLFEFIIVLFLSFFKKNKQIRVIAITYLIAVAGVVSAIVLLLQKANEGGRHIWVFCILGVALIVLFKEGHESSVPKLLIAALFVIFIIRGAAVPTDYDVPFDDRNIKENVSAWEEIFEKENVSLSDNTGYENTVIWVFIDYVDGKQVVTEFNGLYALPKGFGINCCSPDYVLTYFDTLKSKYIFTYDGALVAEECEEYGYKVVGKFGNSVMYERY